MNEKENKLMLVALIVGFIMVVMAIALAAFNFAKSGSNNNVITSGVLKLTLEEGTIINLNDTYPLTDAEGLSSDGYSFTLKNSGTVTTSYEIYIDDVDLAASETRLADKYLKYSLDKNSTVGSVKLFTSLGNNKARLLDSGTIAAGATNTYKLRIFPSVDIDADISGQMWSGKIRVEGGQS